MRLFKKTDWIVQLLLILSATFFLIVKKPVPPRGGFIYPYLIVGGVQLLSVVIHFFLSDFGASKLRKMYLWLLLLTILAGIGILLVDGDMILSYLFIILLWTPLLALIYLIASIEEWRQLNKTT